MKRKTAAKFEAWDEVIKKRLLESEKQSDLSYAYGLLKDPTIYAYAFFKDPNDSDKPLRLYPYQDIVLNDPSNRIVCTWANQTGKSICDEIMALHFALFNPGKTVLITSKDLEQAKDRLRGIRNFLNSSDLDVKSIIGESDNKTEIYFKHPREYEDGEGVKIRYLKESRIKVIPATEAVLSYSVHLAIPDELGFYERSRDFYYRILNPRTYHTKGKIVATSNTNGQQGALWDIWNDEDFSRYNFEFLDCPKNTKEEKEKLRKKLTREEFDSTVLSIFTSPAGGYINLQEREAMQERRENMIPLFITDPLFVFFDFGKSQDRTVRTIGVPIGEGEEIGVNVHEMKEYPSGTGYDVVLDDLRDLIKTVGIDNIVAVGWDNTGVGRGIQDFIEKIQLLGIGCFPVEFSLQNKSRIYTLMKFLIEKNLKGGNGIKIPFVDECNRQLSRLHFKKTSRGYLQVHHAEESDRDDFPDSLVGLCSIIIQPDSVPVTMKRI